MAAPLLGVAAPGEDVGADDGLEASLVLPLPLPLCHGGTSGRLEHVSVEARLLLAFTVQE